LPRAQCSELLASPAIFINSVQFSFFYLLVRFF
jgi:hypothetical protein